ncbi:uncharacterized protein TNCV_4029761 [Trichonephila clavipes]|nr:uncharacterized protein TNCV_4029761 [Trichonephila clavipes]
MHWRHRFPMLFIKLSDTGIGSEDQTQSKPCFQLFLTTEEGFKAATSLQDSPKMFYRIQVWRSGWPFHSFQTVILQILLNNPSSVRSCIIIHQNEVVTNNGSIWADIWIKDLIPISKPVTVSSMEHAGQCGHRARSLPKPGFHHLYNCVFQQCWIDGI